MTSMYYTIRYTSRVTGCERTWDQGFYKGPGGWEMAQMNARLTNDANTGITAEVITI